MTVDLDAVLAEVGKFGPYQYRVLAATALITVIISFSNEYIFTTARIPTRCLIEECEDAQPQEFTPAWLMAAVPVKDGSFDSCQRFAPTSTPVSFNGTCSSEVFDTSVTVACDQFVYENTDTIVYEFGLACDEWRRTMVGSVTTMGHALALPISGYISDRWGRRTALIIYAVNAAWLGLVRYWAQSYLGFVVSEFIGSLMGAGKYASLYILVTELMGPEYHVASGAVTSTGLAVGEMVVTLIAWALPNWRHLILALYTTQFLALGYYWMIPESIRWYLNKGRYDEAEAALKEAARLNGKQLSDKWLHKLREAAEDEKMRQLQADKETAPWLVAQVFRHKPVLLRCVVSPVWWITMTLVYYGLTINAVNMVGNRYVNFVAVAAVEIPGYWLAVFLINRVGRRPVLAAAYFICSACQLGYIFLPAGFGASLGVYLVGKMSISSVATVLYVYTAELYPTQYRQQLFTYSSMLGRIGNILAPLTPAFTTVWPPLPFSVFAAMSLASGLLVFTTPETLGTTLPDTMEQATHLAASYPAPAQAQAATKTAPSAYTVDCITKL